MQQNDISSARTHKDLPARYQEAKRITLIGAAKNTLLSIVKILFGLLGHSHALVADGVHSLSDLLIDGLVLIASRFGSRAADRDHPYGHGRFETAATVLLAFVMALAGIGIVVEAGFEITGFRSAIKPDFFVLWVALFSVLVNEGLYRYTRWVGEKIQSNLLVANAWHHRSDSASSLVVLIGASGAWLGFKLLDPIAAIIVGIMIVRMAWQFGVSSVRELVDTALEESVVEKIKKTIVSVPGVCALHHLRTRSVGGVFFLDVHILVDPTISVSEGHFIGQEVHFRLMREIPGVEDVTVHVDPEDDEVIAPSRNLPTRVDLINLMKQRWSALLPADAIETVILHYLGGKIHIELRLTFDLALDELKLQEIINQLQQKITDIPSIAKIDILFQLPKKPVTL